MSQPASFPLMLKWMRMNFPCQEVSKKNFHKTEKIRTNLDELSFLAVFALPKASSSGLVWTI